MSDLCCCHTWCSGHVWRITLFLSCVFPEITPVLTTTAAPRKFKVDVHTGDQCGIGHDLHKHRPAFSFLSLTTHVYLFPLSSFSCVSMLSIQSWIFQFCFSCDMILSILSRICQLCIDYPNQCPQFFQILLIISQFSNFILFYLDSPILSQLSFCWFSLIFQYSLSYLWIYFSVLFLIFFQIIKILLCCFPQYSTLLHKSMFSLSSSPIIYLFS